MVLELVESLGVWSWFVFGLMLLAVEILAPGTFVLWLGLAAIAVGVLANLVDLTWQSQWIAFAGLSVLAVIAWWTLSRRSPPESDEPMLNRRAARYIGREFVLNEPIVRGHGRVAIDDSVWRVAGEDCPAGSRVRVAGADGSTLLVDRVPR